MSRTTAGDRLRRVLAVVPWIVANPGHRVLDVAARFGLREADLLADLEVVYMVGLPPYSPDALIDVQIDDEGRVSILLADYFSRPLRLTPGQGLALLASSEALLSVPGTDPDGALARALDKLAQVVGVDGADAVDIRLGSAEHDILDQLRLAAAESTEVEIVYYSYNRDARTEREVAPSRVFAESGNWYVHAWCHTAESERTFRVDRIESLRPLHRPAQVPADGVQDRVGVFQPSDGMARITLRLEPEAAWVVENYPSERVEEEADGGLLVELAVTEIPWLERLLVSLGPQAEVRSADGIEGADRLGGDAAARILARYQSN